MYATCAAIMYDTLSVARPAALVIHDDGEALDKEADATRPTLLLADDEPVLLLAMAELLADAGYAVSRGDTGHGAIQLLEHEDFDVIATDGNMDGGNGADTCCWIAQVKPWLAERVVFLADEEGDCAAVVAPGRPMFRKGADSRALTTVLREIVRQVRGEPTPF
jgi:CheY-like chemotaxis protein